MTNGNFKCANLKSAPTKMLRIFSLKARTFWRKLAFNFQITRYYLPYTHITMDCDGLVGWHLFVKDYQIVWKVSNWSSKMQIHSNMMKQGCKKHCFFRIQVDIFFYFAYKIENTIQTYKTWQIISKTPAQITKKQILLHYIYFLLFM